jgi:hypothetical protein
MAIAVDDRWRLLAMRLDLQLRQGYKSKITTLTT